MSWRKPILVGVLSIAGLAAALAGAAGTKEGGAKHARAKGAAAMMTLAPAALEWIDPDALPPGAKLAVVQGDMKTPGRMFGFRIKAPDGYRVPLHMHPNDEHVVVLDGKLHLGEGEVFDQKKTTTLERGGLAVIPEGHHHFAWFEGETVLHIYGVGPWGITYVNPKDDPRLQKQR